MCIGNCLVSFTGMGGEGLGESKGVFFSSLFDMVFCGKWADA